MLQTGGSLVQEQQKGIDSIHQKQIGGPMVQSQRGPSIQNQQAGGLPMGLKMDYEEVQQGRAGNDFYLGSKKEPRMVITQQPKLAAIPLAHNQQVCSDFTFFYYYIFLTYISTLIIRILSIRQIEKPRWKHKQKERELWVGMY